ncbi:uncharacterized protein [Typha angustifolia]|uniref:uncharacterized protein n=1 Tax=Typha angustifolia TaxID=59011 RepID=UPI003C2D18A3
MAIRCCYPSIVIPEGQIRRRITRATMLQNSSRQVTRASIPLRKFPTVKKVFEDQTMGIACYRDESGELVCEGYDEGPRYAQRSPEYTYAQRQRQLQLTDSVDITRLQIVEDIRFHQVIQQHN